jgi:DNA-directed RNA polymerase specialized sigma24 family protein
VRRHLDLVHSAALRQVAGDAHHAEDVTQTVFEELARQARRLSNHRSLAGWLYTTARNVAARRAGRSSKKWCASRRPASRESRPRVRGRGRVR